MNTHIFIMCAYIIYVYILYTYYICIIVMERDISVASEVE